MWRRCARLGHADADSRGEGGGGSCDLQLFAEIAAIIQRTQGLAPYRASDLSAPTGEYHFVLVLGEAGAFDGLDFRILSVASICLRIGHTS